MKNKLFLTCIFLSALVNFSFASKSDLFAYDKAGLQTELSDVQQLETYVLSNPGTTISQIQENPEFSPVAKSLSANPLSPQFSLDNMDWGAFAWGFCCWPVGFFVVILNKSKDNDSKISYLIGVATAFVLTGGVWFGRGGGWYY
jgi:hypothetical protein